MKNLLDGEPVKLRAYGYGTWLWNLTCCDCGLTHLLLIQHHGKGVLKVYPYRDDHLTKKARKKKK